MTTINGDDASFTGSAADDQVLVLGNRAVIDGGRGNDFLSTMFVPSVDDYSDVSTELRGGTGRDILHTIIGLEGFPTTYDERWTIEASLDGGKGDDALWVDILSMYADRSVVANGGEGDDDIRVTSDPIDSGEMAGHYASSEVDGGEGNDNIAIKLTVFGFEELSTTDPAMLSTVHGGDGSDVISSELRGGWGPATNLLFGGDGNDHIEGRISSGGDFPGFFSNEIHGGSGSDEIRLWASGGETNSSNLAFGDEGDDDIVAQAFAGFLDATRTSNEIHGGDGADRITAKLTINGTTMDEPASVNVIHGDAGDDRLSAQVSLEDPAVLAHSEIYGGEGNDRLSVKGGDDNRLEGNQGDDVLLGGAGSDRLIGGQGDDYLRGRGGDDFFVFGGIRDGERDRIADFTIGEDTIDLSGIDARAGVSGNQGFAFGTSHGTGRAWIEQSSGSSSILHADNGRHVLEVVLMDGRDVGPSDYSAGDFIL